MDLTVLSIKHKADKCGVHFYTPHYQRHLAAYKDKPINIMEIGLGGYADPHLGGNSLRVWSEWFTHPDTHIIGIDISEKLIRFDDTRVKIYRGSQVDRAFLEDIHQQYGDFDIIIDDGSHWPIHIIETFRYLYPKLKDGGVYAIEDTKASYWGAASNGLRLNNKDNLVHAYFKQVPDWINFGEIPGHKKPNYFEKHIIGIHFYHNLIVIDKDMNDENPICKIQHPDPFDQKKSVVPTNTDTTINWANEFSVPIIVLDNAVNISSLSLIVHMGGLGDVINNDMLSIISYGKRPNYIEGYTITCKDNAIKDAIEYRVRYHDGGWCDWVTGNNFAGTRGKGKCLTGFSVRLNKQLSDRYQVRVIGAFDNAEGLVIVGDGVECIPKANNAPLYGMQIIFQPTD